jgi:plasmid replication initiation protein
MVYGALFPMPEILIELRMKRTVKFLCFFVMLFCFASMDAKNSAKQTVIP